MHKKIQELWDAAHEIPKGAYIPRDTVLVQLDSENDEISYYMTNSSDYWRGAPKHVPVRSVDPLPDMNDTGTFTVHSDDGFIVLVDTYDDRCYDLSKNQARNLARKLMEAIDE